MSGGNEWKLAVSGLSLSFLPAPVIGPGQEAVLIVCALLFLSLTIVWVALDFWPVSVRKHSSEEKPRSERAARGFGGAAGLIGLIIAAAILYYQININHGFPAWQSLYFMDKILLLAFTVLVTSITAGLMVFNFLAWWHHYWTPATRLHYLAVTLAWLAMVLMIYFWNRVGSSF